MLTSKQRATLRSMAANLDTIFQIGKGGISEETCNQIANALEARELIKARVLDNSGYTAKEAANEIASVIGCDVVSCVGTRFVLYKESTKKKEDRALINKKRRVGIFGGTFNPPHIAHVRVAKAFRESMDLDQIMLIPTNEPPHKSYSGSVSADDRFKMCQLAFSDIPNACVSDIEIARGGKSYTVETLSKLWQEDTELYLLCGTDMFLSLDTWFQAERIFALASICYVRREADADVLLIEQKREKYINEFGARIFEIPTAVEEISSTEVRERMLSGDFSGIPTSVIGYIKERNLYQ